MTTLQTAHTADLTPEALAAARDLLWSCGGMTEHDWEHSLGGVRAIMSDGAELVGHASVIGRRLLYGGKSLRTGYVEGVAVRADRRRLGYGATMMDALERVIRGAYDLGALGATDEAVVSQSGGAGRYWQGGSSALTPTGIRPTGDDDGYIYVLPGDTPLDLAADLDLRLAGR